MLRNNIFVSRIYRGVLNVIFALIPAPKFHFCHVAQDVQQDKVMGGPLCRSLPVWIAPHRDDSFVQGNKMGFTMVCGFSGSGSQVGESL